LCRWQRAAVIDAIIRAAIAGAASMAKVVDFAANPIP
jgi:hypothetical protein